MRTNKSRAAATVATFTPNSLLATASHFRRSPQRPDPHQPTFAPPALPAVTPLPSLYTQNSPGSIRSCSRLFFGLATADAPNSAFPLVSRQPYFQINSYMTKPPLQIPTPIHTPANTSVPIQTRYHHPLFRRFDSSEPSTPPCKATNIPFSSQPIDPIPLYSSSKLS